MYFDSARKWRADKALRSRQESRSETTDEERAVKKFMISHFGFEKPTPRIMEAWREWFESIADKQVDIASIRIYEVRSM